VKAALRIGGAVLLVLFLAVFIPGGGAMGDALFHLLFGWVSFIGGVLPKVSVDPAGLATFLACLALAGLVGHGFCRWLWRETGHDEAWKPRWTAAGLGVVVLLFAAGMAFTGVAHQTGWLLRRPVPLFSSSGRASNDRNASASLKVIASAQADFRANDRDGDRIQNFWRGDIAGLYMIQPPGSTEMIKLIELSMVGADAAPRHDVTQVSVKAPKSGYWFKALRYRNEETPDPNRFAACAYPTHQSGGRVVFIITEENTIYSRRVTEAKPPEFYPDDPAKEGWTKLD
jgi:hypothetical protein